MELTFRHLHFVLLYLGMLLILVSTIVDAYWWLTFLVGLLLGVFGLVYYWLCVLRVSP